MIKKEKRDKILMQHLRKHTKESLWKLSHKAKIPVSTIYHRLKQLEEQAILKYTVLVNFSSLGYQGQAFISLKISKIDRDEVIVYLENHSKVNSIYEVHNGYDLLLEVIFSDLKEVEDFVEEMKKDFPIEKANIMSVIRSIKKETFAGDENLYCD